MDSVREAWTDERLDDLNHRVDEGGRIDAMQRTIILFGAGMFTALAALFATQLALIFTQL
jgi:hypothetical protein